MSKAPNPDRAATWDTNAMADALFGKGGGLAVWLRREEGAARACVRHAGGDIVQTVMDVAALRIGLDALTASLAEVEGIPLEQFNGMVTIAEEESRKRVEHATRIKPAGGGE